MDGDGTEVDYEETCRVGSDGRLRLEGNEFCCATAGVAQSLRLCCGSCGQPAEVYVQGIDCDTSNMVLDFDSFSMYSIVYLEQFLL